jgi:hypothetical protein
MRREHIIAFAWQQWIREHGTVLRFTYIVRLVTVIVFLVSKLMFVRGETSLRPRCHDW